MFAPRGRLARYNPQTKVCASDVEWTVIVKGLLEHGIMGPLAPEGTFQCCGRPLLNGAIAVPKGAYKEGQPLPHQRLIMNLLPGNY
eukprot:5140742-Amphidinium_carterae.2